MKQLFQDRREWISSWSKSRQDGLRGSGSCEAKIVNVAHYLGGAMRDGKFHLFNNGGAPLIERREGDWIQEIVFRSSAMRDGRFCVTVHVSHKGLADVRRLCWGRLLSPTYVGGGDIGELDIPPCRIIWDAIDCETTADQLVEWVERVVSPWLAAFFDSKTLDDGLRFGVIPLVHPATLIEVALVERGRNEAKKLLNIYRREHSDFELNLPSSPWDQARLKALRAYFRLE